MIDDKMIVFIISLVMFVGVTLIGTLTYSHKLDLEAETECFKALACQTDTAAVLICKRRFTQ